jgi:hypothetical protein
MILRKAEKYTVVQRRNPQFIADPSTNAQSKNQDLGRKHGSAATEDSDTDISVISVNSKFKLQAHITTGI